LSTLICPEEILLRASRFMEENPRLHASVMVEEVVRYLDPKPGGKHLELGVSTGGHLLRVCKLISPGGFAVAVDLDGQAIEIARRRIEETLTECRVVFLQGDYGELPALLSPAGIPEDFFNSCVLDAGMSGFQLEGGRGFSYKRDQELDMRFDPGMKLTAKELVNGASVEELSRILAEVGDIPEAAKVAAAIAKARAIRPINTTFELIEAVSEIWPEKMPYGKRMRRLGQLFMALRDIVNPGAKGLRGGIEHAVKYLSKNKGRFALLTFSGGENRVAKSVLNAYRRPGESNSDWVVKEITPGAVRPSRQEVKANPAAHSAMLRVFERRAVAQEKE